MKNIAASDAQISDAPTLGDKKIAVLCWMVLACWLLAATAYVVWGRYTEDEGFYSVIGREVWKGRALYADIRCSQMPLLPYFYGAFFYFLPARIESGRVLSLLVTFAGLCFCWRLASTRYGERAGFLGLLVLALSRQLLFDGTQVRTQALSFGLASGCLFYLSAFDLRRRKHHKSSLVPEDLPLVPDEKLKIHSDLLACLSGLLAGASVLARLSFLPLAVIVPFYGAWLARRFYPQRQRAMTLCFVVSSWGLPMSVVLYFWWQAGDRFFFDVYKYHRLLGAMVTINKIELARDAIGSALNATPVWSAVLTAGAVVALRNLWHFWRTLGSSSRNSSFQRGSEWEFPAFEFPVFEFIVLATWATITFGQMIQPMFSGAHQSPLGWAAAIWVAYLSRGLFTRHTIGRNCWIREHRTAFIGIAILIASVVAWPLQEGTLFWARADRFRTPAGIYDLAAPLRATPGRNLAAFDPGLAFCAPQIHLLPGYEMGVWSMVPALPVERQEYFRGISGRRLQDDLLHHADFFVAREWDFVNLHAGDPKFNLDDLNAVLPRYEMVYDVPIYGHLGQGLVLWRRRPAH